MSKKLKSHALQGADYQSPITHRRLPERMHSHKDLDAWKRSMDLVDSIYKVTKSFPNEEVYSLTNQMRRAAISIPSNIAEGAARGSKNEFIQFLYIALGSLSELETQAIIADRLGYLTGPGKLLENIEVIRKLINGLIYSLKRDRGKSE